MTTSSPGNNQENKNASEKSSLLLLSQTIPLARLQPVLAREFPQLELVCFADLRKALACVKRIKPQIIVAEFIYAPTYGSQLSNYEALSATLQRHSPLSRFIALVSRQDRQHIDRLGNNVEIDILLDLPLNFSALVDAIIQLQCRNESH